MSLIKVADTFHQHASLQPYDICFLVRTPLSSKDNKFIGSFSVQMAFLYNGIGNCKVLEAGRVRQAGG